MIRDRYGVAIAGTGFPKNARLLEGMIWYKTLQIGWSTVLEFREGFKFSGRRRCTTKFGGMTNKIKGLIRYGYVYVNVYVPDDVDRMRQPVAMLCSYHMSAYRGTTKHDTHDTPSEASNTLE